MPANSTPEALHVLHLSSWYPEGPASRNGIFIIRQVEALAAQCVKSGLVAAPLSKEGKHELQKKEELGVWHYIHAYGTGNNPLVQAWRQLRAMNSAIRSYLADRGKPDLLVVHVAWKAGWWALWLHYRYNIPFVLAEHWSGYLPQNAQFKGFLLRYLTQMVTNRAETIVCPSALLADAMQAHHLKNRYELIPNVVDTTVYKKIPGQQRKGYFLHVSNLAPVKRFDLVLERFQRFRALHPEATLKVAGAYDIAAARQKFTGQLNGVELLGVQSAETLAELYASANGMVLCSEFETFSIVVPEALACGCRVLAPDLPALKQHQLLGPLSLVEPADEQAWDAALQACWLEQPAADESANHREHPYNAAVVGQKWLKLLKRIRHVA